ncbi:MAG: magnesium transporter [Patescibacteria group bacterium]
MLKETVGRVHDLTYHPKERMDILRRMTVPEQSAIFEKLSPYVQQSILGHLRTGEVVNMLDHMDMHQAAHILSRIQNQKKRDQIILRLKGDIKEKVDFFLRFHPKATLALINFNYLFLPADHTVGDAAKVIEEHYAETGRYPELLLHENGKLIGEVPFSVMVKERNSSGLRKFVQSVATITYQANVEEIVSVLTATGSKKIVVLDHDTSVLGIIYADTAKTLFGDMPAESLYDFTGVDDSERPFDSVYRKVRNRYKWLILNLATSFLAGSVILSFQKTLDAVTILSVYIPIVAGMGGNSASQAFAVTLRGITLGIVRLETALPVLRKEALAGLINGLIIGSIVAFISSVWNGNPLLGLVVGCTLVFSHVIAPVTGTFLPLILKYFGKDPAATSSIFITTVTDVCGLIFLFGFATLVLL